VSGTLVSFVLNDLFLIFGEEVKSDLQEGNKRAGKKVDLEEGRCQREYYDDDET